MSDLPISSYRVQMNKQFTFDDLRAQIKSKAELGYTHIQVSPIMQATPGSTHGYDVTDYNRINPELGGREGFNRLAEEMKLYGMKLIVDIVPNHMSTTSAWFDDVYAKGKDSKFANYFDIDWKAKGKLRGKVLAPFLGGKYRETLDKYKYAPGPDGKPEKEICIKRIDGELRVTYYDHSFPLSPETGKALEKRIAADPEALDRINNDSAQMDRILKRQHYLLAHHIQKNKKHNYRMFFQEAEMAGVRTENKKVFEAQTELLKELVATSGVIDAVRVDHIDGLRDPRQYLNRLQKRLEVPVLSFAEKILGYGEVMRDDWKVDGDSGYRFMSTVAPLMTDPRNNEVMTQIYSHFIGEQRDYQQMGYDNKHKTTREMLLSPLKRVSRYLKKPLADDVKPAGFTKKDVRAAVDEVAANFPHYRSYVVPKKNIVSAEDEHLIATALAGAREKRPDLVPLIDRIGDVLLLKDTGKLQTEFVLRFQQFLPAVMAKGIEDTTFFGWNRTIGGNEVGSDPAQSLAATTPAVAIGNFHAANIKTQETTPLTISALSTHDTKLSEGVRARLGLLSRMPEQWQEAVIGWNAQNEGKKTNNWPDCNSEYAIYQAMVGTWPIEQERMQLYVTKRMKEAKEHTSWISPNDDYEKAVHDFVGKLYADPDFLASMQSFVEPLIIPGFRHALVQTLFKQTSPGSPETYQGCDLFNNLLVDPDNRRPVDYTAMNATAAHIAGLPVEDRMAIDNSGAAKLWLIAASNAVRQDYPASYGAEGDYEPMATSNGTSEDHIVAYWRGDARGPTAISIGNLLDDAPDGTTLHLPEGTWLDRLTGNSFKGGRDVAVSDLLQNGSPVALLVRPEFADGARRPCERIHLLGDMPKPAALEPSAEQLPMVASNVLPFEQRRHLNLQTDRQIA